MALSLSSPLSLPLSPIANTVSYGVVEGKTPNICLFVFLSNRSASRFHVFVDIFLCQTLTYVADKNALSSVKLHLHRAATQFDQLKLILNRKKKTKKTFTTVSIMSLFGVFRKQFSFTVGVCQRKIQKMPTRYVLSRTCGCWCFIECS